MINLYYTRHGQSFINTGDTWADLPGSDSDLGLTETGVAQAKEGANQAKTSFIKPDIIICSPLKRTRETAEIYANILNYPLDKIEYNDLFLEIQVGPELEGTSFSEFISKYTYADFDKFEGAETIEMLQERAKKALDYAKGKSEKTVLIVSHSCFGRAFARAVESRPFTDEFVAGKNSSLPFGMPIKLV